jgi:hypothetical protein
MRTVHASVLTVVLLLAACGSDTPTADSDPAPAAGAEDADDGHEGDASGDPCPVSGNTRTVSAACIDPWPLTVDSGLLSCNADSVTISTGGTVYAVNGMAETRGDGIDIDPVWADNPDLDGLKVNIGGLIDAGLALC